MKNRNEENYSAIMMSIIMMIMNIIFASQKKIKSGFLSAMYDEFENDHSELLLGDCRIPLIGLLSRNTGMHINLLL